MRFLTLACFGLAALTQAQNTTVEVQVGGTTSEAGGAFQFKPSSFNATNGSVITFEFSGIPGNHSITQSTFASPCQPMSGGFDSGWVLIEAPASSTPIWNLTITDDSTPIWFFCKQLLPSPHCAAGMVGAINPPSSGNTFSSFVTNAKSASSSGQEIGALVGVGASASAIPGPIPSGVTLFGTPGASATSGASGSSASSTSSASAGTSAGYMIQPDSFLALLAALMGIALV